MFLDTFIHRVSNSWRITDAFSGLFLFSSDSFGIIRKKDFIVRVKKDAELEIPSRLYKKIIKSCENSYLLSPRYELITRW